MNVGQMMTRKVTTIGLRDTLERARSLMLAGKFSRLPVLDGGKLVGIVSDRDVRQHAGHLEHTLVDAAMTEPVVTVAPSEMMESAARLMLKHKIGGLPVVEDGELRGIVTTTDIVQGFVRLLGLSEEGVSRIDLAAEDTSEMAQIIGLIGAEVGQLLGVGSYQADWHNSRIAYVRVPSSDANRAADLLEQQGFKVLAVHS